MSTPTMRPYLRDTARFADGSDSPRAFLERCLESLAAWEPQVGAFVCTNLENARTAADASSARWRAGRQRSALDGMPLGVKDIIETEDMPTQMGSPLFDGWRSGWDAASVAALRDAGAVIVGKTVTTEFAATEPRGTRNPHDLERTPGGSSSGSAAAVAAGMLSTALGTQVVGSVLRPAGYCGVVGFKPSVGALNRGGSHDHLSQSCTGVLAASLEDTWQVAIETASRVGGDPGYEQLAGPMQAPAAKAPRRLALIETGGWPQASDKAKQALQDAVVRLNASGVEILTRRSHGEVEAAEQAMADAFTGSRRIVTWESRWPLIAFRARNEALLSETMRKRAAVGDAMTADEHRADLAARERARTGYAALSQICDGCITLSATGAAPVGLSSTGSPIFAAPSSYLGTPAVSLPVLKEQNLPLGLQLMGFFGCDADVFAHAAHVLRTLGAAA